MMENRLDKVISAQKKGTPSGIYSVCSSHPVVLLAALRFARDHGSTLLVEATCNQVNQFGGYTGMQPRDFVSYMHDLAAQAAFPAEKLILGGDHLGPNVWTAEPAEDAMRKSVELAAAYASAGFTKIHLDASMRVAGDPEGILSPEVIAQRTAQMAAAVEKAAPQPGRIRYVIGTEVPVPGGAKVETGSMHVSVPNDVLETIRINQMAFAELGLGGAWNRVIAVVAQPGVEFGDDEVHAFEPEKALHLTQFIQQQKLVFEAHSTDYQSVQALTQLVAGQFAILKVGPELTFAYREALFGLSFVEDSLIAKEKRSHLLETIDQVMLSDPKDWKKYYSGTEQELALKRKFSLSDRMRYYWVKPEIHKSLNILMQNLTGIDLPLGLLSQYFPLETLEVLDGYLTATPEKLIEAHIQRVLRRYQQACSL
jgi:D-tagatose-1,6-bisphosphate aldolase subunit GatZ/KbaZ